MATKGTRRNPFSGTEFRDSMLMNCWEGGWVKNGVEMSYYSQTLERYTCIGSKRDPIPYLIFREMEQFGIWEGGWVLDNQLLYYDASRVQYPSSYGSENHPWPINVYYEMTSNGIWASGWIQENDGTKRYIQSIPIKLDSGEGCSGGSSGNEG